MSSGSGDRRSIGGDNAGEHGWLALWADAWQTPVAGLWRQAMAAQSDAVLAWWKAFGGGLPGALAYTMRGVRLGGLRQPVAAWPASLRFGQSGCLGAADLRAAPILLAGRGCVVEAPLPVGGGVAATAIQPESLAAHRDQHAGAPVPSRADRRPPLGQVAAPVARKAASGTVARGGARIKRPVIR